MASPLRIPFPPDVQDAALANRVPGTAGRNGSQSDCISVEAVVVRTLFAGLTESGLYQPNVISLMLPLVTSP